MAQNPYNVPQKPPQDKQKPVSSGKAAYNVVTDTVTGVNVRGSDNKIQAIFVVASMLLFALIGAVAAALNSDWNLPWYGGALIGGFLGAIVGVFTSGIFLMFYRASRHMKGKHD